MYLIFPALLNAFFAEKMLHYDESYSFTSISSSTSGLYLNVGKEKYLYDCKGHSYAASSYS